MQRLLPTTILVFSLLPAMAQQVLFTEDFEGAQPAFTLNTVDMGSTAGGDNFWLVNNAYAGGDGTFNCLGIPFTFNIPTTAAQPAGINNANGNYLHIISAAAVASGINNCNFAAADGFCTNAANHFARMTSDVVTLGASDITLSFWWLCAGGPNSYGELYYSTDAGSTWALVSTPIATYRNQSAWSQQTVTLPAFAGQATLRFGFRFVNATAAAASDPAFGIDDLSISATTTVTAIVTDTLSGATYCPGSSLSVPFSATGAWNAGNVFTAELSDVNGNFAAPVAIGTLSSTTSGVIAATIPAATVTGSGYLVRVTGSDPLVAGSASVTTITIIDAPYAGQDTHIALCSNSGPHALMDDMPGASACGVWTSPTGNAIPDTLDPTYAMSGAYTYTTNCPGGCPQDTAVLTVGITQAPDAGESATVTICSNAPPVALLNLLEGTPDAGGTWSGNTIGGIYNPPVDSSGCSTYTVTGTAPCPAASATVCVVEDPCTGIPEADGGPGAVRWLGQQGSVHRFDVSALSLDGVEVYDATGRKMTVRAQSGSRSLTIDLGGAAPGIYLFRLKDGGGTAVLRFVNGE